jgi:hypothetical protein
LRFSLSRQAEEFGYAQALYVIAIGAVLMMAMPPALAKNLFARTPLSDSARCYLPKRDIGRSPIVFWKIARAITKLQTSN